VTRRGTDDPVKVRSALSALETPGPLGLLRIDPATNHAGLPFLLGRISGADFVILQSRPATAADPYLIHRRTAAQPRSAQPHLRIVS
jgi:branched-chain amino acid transport system substrate-binding protein